MAVLKKYFNNYRSENPSNSISRGECSTRDPKSTLQLDKPNHNMQDWTTSCLGKCRNQVNICWEKELLIDSANIHMEVTLALNIVIIAIM